MTNGYYITNLGRELGLVRLAESAKEAVANEDPSNDVDCFREERGIKPIYAMSVKGNLIVGIKRG